MKQIAPGVFDDKGLLWTESRAPGRAVYGELLRQRKNVEYRSWHPNRSKMAALLRKSPKVPWLSTKDHVLYLGAASGTTVSHMSDITEGPVYAVEFSPRSTRDLIWNVESRDNVVPILADAGAPQTYAPLIHRRVDVLIQDVAQRHQVDIFLRNMPMVRKGGRGYLMVKARSISVKDEPSTIYKDVERRLREAGLKVTHQVDLDPYETDHRAFVVQH